MINKLIKQYEEELKQLKENKKSDKDSMYISEEQWDDYIYKCLKKIKQIKTLQTDMREWVNGGEETEGGFTGYVFREGVIKAFGLESK